MRRGAWISAVPDPDGPQRSSTVSARRLSAGALVALLVLWVFAHAAFADAARGIRAATTRPIAPRGGVLMLPLLAQRPGDQWPGSLSLRLADGSTIEGLVAWMHPRPIDPRQRRAWTSDARNLAIRLIEPADDTTAGDGGAPYLLARLPANGTGSIRLGNQKLQPIWCDRPPAPVLASDVPQMKLAEAPNRPDPSSPFEYWRWPLLAEERGLRPPEAEAFGPAGALAAEHYADLVAIALDRLKRADPAAADACTSELTRLARDRQRGVEFAVWVADPAAVTALLSVLLDLDRGDEVIARDAAIWLASRPRLLLWREADWGEQVRLVMVNRTPQPLVARIAWERSDDIPLGLELPPGVLTQVVVERPPPPTANGPVLGPPGEPREQVLRVDLPEETIRLTYGVRVAAVRPPGVPVGLFAPALTLAEVEARRQRPLDPRFATTAQLRRLGGRWELFFDCRRPPSPKDPPAADALQRLGDWEDLHSLEVVTLLIGPEDRPTVALTIPETGWHRLFAGANDGTLQIHRRSYEDRWYCRIVLPRRWLEAVADADGVRLACRRTHGGGDAAEWAPNATVPWRRSSARLVVTLEQWDDLP